MITLQDMPEEIKNFIVAHGLVRPEAFADEHQVGVQLALARVITLTMSTFEEITEQPSGREVVWNMAHEAADGPGPGGGPAVVSQRGAGLVKSVLDDRYYGTAHAIAAAAGVQTASVGQLIDVVTAAALEIMGGLVAKRHWNAQQLGQWLRPRQEIDPAALAGFIPEAAAPGMKPAAGKKASWLASRANVVLLVVGSIAVAELGYILGTRPGSSPAEETASAAPAAADSRQYTAVPVANRSEPALNAAGPAARVPVVLKLRNGVRQIIGANSTESKLYQFLIDPDREVDLVDPTKGWIGFDRIYFESSKAVLTNESLWQLSNVASILKRFPAAKVKVGGYTDSSGNPLLNLKLSEERARAAVAALVSLGVPAGRLAAMGYGAQDNLASNDTEEGRALNRRVSLQVTEK